jgi:hypothetical protein
MILRRLTSSLKEQHWMTIVIELLIVIVGVFIGTQVSNWNEGRLQRRQTARMLEQLRPELALDIDYFESVRSYYRVTRKYADIALAGWNRDPRISDSQFVIAAYQASQIYGIGTNAQNWTLIFGGEQVRDIDDPTLRRHLSYVLTSDYADVALATMQTPYRTGVRLVIPNEIQVAIRATCGDQFVRDAFDQYVYVLSDRCALSLDPAKAAAAAKALRASTSLANQLALHLGSIEAYLQNVDFIEIPMRTLEDDLDKRS